MNERFLIDIDGKFIGKLALYMFYEKKTQGTIAEENRI